jgi:hypothetical protein
MSKNTKKLKKSIQSHQETEKSSEKDCRKKPKRSLTLYPALEPGLNLKTRQEEIDDVRSYFHKLSPEEKAWMNAFMEEENNANFNHNGPKLNKSREDKKRIYNKNNARNRCILTREKAQGKLVFYERLEDLEKK